MLQERGMNVRGGTPNYVLDVIAYVTRNKKVKLYDGGLVLRVRLGGSYIMYNNIITSSVRSLFIFTN
jgi:hypothetical protein